VVIGWFQLRVLYDPSIHLKSFDGDYHVCSIQSSAEDLVLRDVLRR
jgi:hypothetical protein